jgi:hypothetical protein
MLCIHSGILEIVVGILNSIRNNTKPKFSHFTSYRTRKVSLFFISDCSKGNPPKSRKKTARQNF